jgi:large subunit ribosomal protein L20
MPRVKRSVPSRHRRKKVLKAAKGYRGASSKLYRSATVAVDRARAYAYRDRKVRKRDFRRLWIVRINAAARQHGLSYAQFMGGVHKNGIGLDRKMLADMAVNEPDAFARIAEMVKA